MTQPSVPPRRGRTLKLILLFAIAIPVVLFGLYTWGALTWTYADGDRAGIVQKFSRKGWLCKTYEGELAMSIVPGVTPVIWDFTVRDDHVVQGINASLGKRVVLHYRQHQGVPTSCFGETMYYVDSVRVVE